MPLPIPSAASRFKTLDERIKRNLIEAGQALEEIKERELWRHGGFESFKQYCESIGHNYQWAYRKMAASKVAASLPDVPIKNQATAIELGKINPPERRQAALDAIESGDGKLSAQAVKNAAKTIPTRKAPLQKKPNGPKDATGLPIPPEIQEFWNRNEEIVHLLGMVKKVRKTLETADRTSDLMFKMMDRQGTIARLKMAEEEIECAMSYAVCPECNGVLFKDCPICQGRGSLSKFWWEQRPEEERKLREA